MESHRTASPLSLVLLVAALAPAAGAALAPGGPALRVDPAATACRQQYPVVEALAGGRFLAVWEHRGGLADEPSVRGRFLGADGEPLAASFEIAPAPSLEPAVAAAPGGGFLVAWEATDQVVARLFQADGSPAGPARTVPGLGTYGRPAATALDDGGFMVVGTSIKRIDGHLLDESGTLVGDVATPLDLEPTTIIPVGYYDAHVEASPDGFVVAYHKDSVFDRPSVVGLRVRIVDRTDDPVTMEVERVPLASGQIGDGAALAVAPDGSWLVAWRELEADGHDRVMARHVAADGTPGSAFRLDPGRMEVLSPPAAVIVGDDFAVAWPGAADAVGEAAVYVRPAGESGPLGPPLTLHRSDDPAHPDLAVGSGTVLAVWQEGTQPPGVVDDVCFSSGIFAAHLLSPTDQVLLLGDGRFEATVTWEDPYNGGTGAGTAAPLTDDSGSFWFFAPDNVELLVKVVDGRAVNGHFWLFYGSLSTVGYTLEVHDAVGDVTRTFTNPPFHLASDGDTGAFPAEGTGGPRTPHPRPQAVTGPAGPCTSPSLPVVRRPGLCLGDRFEVEVEWADPYNGGTGVAEGSELTGASGTMWFFHPDNAELIVKVLDGRPLNDHFWVFGGSLTSVEYTVTVTDTVTGEGWSHHKPPFDFASFSDTSALPAQ